MVGKILRVRYEVTQALSEGPIFNCFSARDRVQARDVAVRTLRPPFESEPAFVEAVADVVKKVSTVKHPGVERLLELDDDDGFPFVVSEASHGAPMADRIRRFAPFSVPVAASTSISICEALAALHSTGVAHGDIGSHNIVVTPEGETRLQLAGVWESYSASQTAGSVVLASMAPFLAPEISAGGLPTPRSDVYGAGVVLFSLLSGRMPFAGDTPVALAMKHATDPVPSVRSLNGSVPTAMEEIVRRALAKDPAERYATAGSMLSELRIVQDALRFGKSLKAPEGEATRGERAEARVAPTMSAARPEPRPGSRGERRSREAVEGDADIPRWLRFTVGALVSLVALMALGWTVFNLNKPKQVGVPELKRLTIAEAESRLKSLGLRMRIAKRSTSEQFASDTVTGSEPTPGSKVYEGGSVGVFVSDGSRFVEVPDLRGLTVDKAKVLLHSLGLVLDERVIEEREREVERGLIVRQVPEPRTKHERGTSIRVRISSGTEPAAGSGADENRKYLYTIKIKLTDLSEPVVLRVDMTDTRGTKTIHEEMHAPEEEIELTAEGYGGEAVFRIFYDGDLVTQVTKKADQEAEPA